MNDQRIEIMSHRKSSVVTIPMTRSSIVVCKTGFQLGNGNTELRSLQQIDDTCYLSNLLSRRYSRGHTS